MEINVNAYNDIDGLLVLRERVREKLENVNKLDMQGQEVMITAGGNQAFVNVALALFDPGDPVLVVRFWFSRHF